jgi:hypothetical protein
MWFHPAHSWQQQPADARRGLNGHAQRCIFRAYCVGVRIAGNRCSFPGQPRCIGVIPQLTGSWRKNTYILFVSKITPHHTKSMYDRPMLVSEYRAMAASARADH